MKWGYGRAHRWLVGLGIAASLVGLAGCGNAASSVAHTTSTATALPPTLSVPTATVGPHVTTITGTSAPTTGPTPAWRKAALPAGFGLAFHESDIEPAASNGNIAYACAAVPAQPPSQAYAITSANAGASFGSKAQVGSGWGSCAQVVVDELVPSRAIAYQDSGMSGEFTTNGGATWQPFSTTFLRQMATIGATTYAVQGNENSQPDSLIASSDGMRAWRHIALPVNAGGAPFAYLWAQSSGSLLIETGGDNAPTSLNVSSNGGSTWKPVLMPSDAFYPNFVYALGTSSGAWNICGMYDTSNTDAITKIACTRDSGATWSILPLIGDGSQSGPQLSGVTTDGAVLATSNGSMDTTMTLYRWQPGATRWQSLGAVPPYSGGIRYYPTASGGVLWSFVYESDGAGAPPAVNDIYSAPYPAA